MRPALRLPYLLSVLVALSLASGGQAQPHAPGATADRAADLQGDQRAFMNNANVRAFYALSVATLSPGAPPVDVAAYEAQSFAIFRTLGASMGGSPEAMQDHLKLIPRQVVDIVKADPKVLDSFETFTEVLVGPK